MKRALCVGINDYPGTANDLQGCVNDALDWKDLLVRYGFSVETLLNSQAKRMKILEKLEEYCVYANDGDHIVFTYSGHGTQAVDMNTDEGDGYDEALYLYDGILIDDDIRAVLSNLNPDVTFTFISDSCFSGTVTRKIRGGEYVRPRFVPNPDVKPSAKLIKRLIPEEEMRVMLLSGCSDSEYSYDAFIGGRYNGAFTRWAINTFDSGLLFSEWYKLIRDILPSAAYPQTPQLEGVKKHTLALGIETGDEEDPIPDPEPIPDEDHSN